jgi:hypothetical protein
MKVQYMPACHCSFAFICEWKRRFTFKERKGPLAPANLCLILMHAMGVTFCLASLYIHTVRAGFKIRSVAAYGL